MTDRQEADWKAAGAIKQRLSDEQKHDMNNRPPLEIDRLYRNDTNNWKKPDDEFNKMFRSQGKGIQNAGGFRFKSKTTCFFRKKQMHKFC